MMNWLVMVWEWLLPATDDVLLRGRAGLVMATCLTLIVSLIFMPVVWVVSRDLDKRTVAGYTFLVILIAGIASLARAGNVSLAIWLLIILLLVVIAVTTFIYGVVSLPASSFIVPVSLAACGLGLGAALGIAGFGALYIWALAWAENAGWYSPRLGRHISHLTYNAPVLTVLFLVIALVVGVWNDYLNHILFLSLKK